MATDRLLDFGLDIERISAFCLRGTMRQYSTRKLHLHAFHQILFICNGVTVLECADGKTPLFGTAAAFIPSGVEHKSQVVGERVHYISLYFHQRFYPVRYRTLKLFEISELGLALLKRLSSKRLKDVTLGISGECFKLLMTVLHEDWRRKAKMLELPVSQNKDVSTITDYIHSHYQDKLTWSNLNAVSPYSQRHIHRIFVREMNVGIFDYLRMYRILMAAVSLSDRHASIAATAYACGYESLSSFYTDFNKFFGMTPRTFQKSK